MDVPCLQCKAVNPEGGQFCQQCGAPIQMAHRQRDSFIERKRSIAVIFVVAVVAVSLAFVFIREGSIVEEYRALRDSGRLHFSKGEWQQAGDDLGNAVAASRRFMAAFSSVTSDVELTKELWEKAQRHLTGTSPGSNDTPVSANAPSTPANIEVVQSNSLPNQYFIDKFTAAFPYLNEALCIRASDGRKNIKMGLWESASPDLAIASISMNGQSGLQIGLRPIPFTLSGKEGFDAIAEDAGTLIALFLKNAVKPDDAAKGIASAIRAHQGKSALQSTAFSIGGVPFSLSATINARGPGYSGYFIRCASLRE